MIRYPIAAAAITVVALYWWPLLAHHLTVAYLNRKGRE